MRTIYLYRVCASRDVGEEPFGLQLWIAQGWKYNSSCWAEVCSLKSNGMSIFIFSKPFWKFHSVSIWWKLILLLKNESQKFVRSSSSSSDVHQKFVKFVKSSSDELDELLTNFWRTFDELDELLMNVWRTWRTSDELDNFWLVEKNMFLWVVVKSHQLAHVVCFFQSASLKTSVRRLHA